MKAWGWAFSGAALLPWACGGMAVIDGAGGTAAGSGSSTTSSSSTTTATSTTTGGGGAGPMTCEQLYAEYITALEVAMACDTCDPGPNPCGHTNQDVADPCGCPVPVNAHAPDAVAAAVAAHVAWKSAECGPYECGQPCAISSEPRCLATGSGCAGVCAY